MSTRKTAWRSVRKALPGTLLSGQNPQLSDEVYSVERVSSDRWKLYQANKQEQGNRQVAEISCVGEFDARGLYGELMDRCIDVPDSSLEQAPLNLPSPRQVYWNRVSDLLPGYLLDAWTVYGSMMVWELWGSISWDGGARWNLHYCGEPSSGDWLEEPQIITEWSCTEEQLLDTCEELGLEKKAISRELRDLKRDPARLQRILVRAPAEPAPHPQPPPSVSPPEAPRGDILTAFFPETRTEHEHLSRCLAVAAEYLRHPFISRVALLPTVSVDENGLLKGTAVETRDVALPALHAPDVSCSIRLTLFSPPGGTDIERMLAILRSTHHHGRTDPPMERQANFTIAPVLEEAKETVFRTNFFLCGLYDLALSQMATCGARHHFTYLGHLRQHDEELDRLLLLPALGCPAPPLYALVTHCGTGKLGEAFYQRAADVARQETARFARDIPAWGAFMRQSGERFGDYREALGYLRRWSEENHERLHTALLTNLFSGRRPPQACFYQEHNSLHRLGESRLLHTRGCLATGKFAAVPLAKDKPILIGIPGKGADRVLSCVPQGSGQVLPPEAAPAARSPEVVVECSSGPLQPARTRLYAQDADRLKRQLVEYDLLQILGQIEPLAVLLPGGAGE